MNVEKLFDAVDFDAVNTPLGVICYELEQQGYKVRIEGIDIVSSDLHETIFSDLSESSDEFRIELLKDGLVEQKFKLVFTDSHRFSIHQAV